MLYDMGTGGEALHNPQPDMTRRTVRTPEQLAAFKAANLNQKPEVITIDYQVKPARKSQRQEWQELLDETVDMISAAKRQGYFHAIPALVQRYNTFNSLLQGC
jgi:hypothetical protein